MADPTTSIYLNSQNPPAQDGYENSKFQTDGLEPQQSVTAEHTNNGGVVLKQFDYAIQTKDCGKLIVCTSASPSTTVTFYLPHPPPAVGDDGKKWRVSVQNLGSDNLYLSPTSGSPPTGVQLDGSSSSLELLTNQGVVVFTDGTNYYTERGIGSSGPPPGSITRYIESFFGGTPADSQLMLQIVIPSIFTFPTNFSGAGGEVRFNPGATVTLTVQFLNSSRILQASGSISISTAGAFTFTLSSPYVSTAFDILTITNQASHDTSLGDVSMVIPFS